MSVFRSLLARVVSTPEEQKNFLNDTARNIFTGLLPVFASVSIMQAFALEHGVGESSVGLFNTLSNAFAVFGMLSVMSAADNLTGKRLVRVSALWNLPVILMPLLMLAMSLTDRLLSPTAFLLLTALAFSLNAIALNVRSIFVTKMVRFTYLERSYGTALGTGGLIFYVVALLAGFTVEPILSTSHGYTVLFALAALSVLGALFFSSRLIFLESEAAPTPTGTAGKVRPQEALRTIFTTPPLRMTLLMHLGRGVINAFVFCFVIIGSNHFQMPLTGAAYITLITTFASILAYVLVTLIYNPLGSVLSAFFSLGLCVLGAVWMLLASSTLAFYAAIALFQTGNIFFGQLTPIVCCKITPPQTLGSFTVIRIVPMQAVEALFTLLFSSIVTGAPLSAILIPVLLSLGIQLFCCARAFRDIPSEAGCLLNTLKQKHRKKEKTL